MFCIFLREDGMFGWYLPINAESVIKDADAAISLWMIEVITLVLEDAISERTAKPWAKPFGMKNWT